jgi:hypothetical protein
MTKTINFPRACHRAPHEKKYHDRATHSAKEDLNQLCRRMVANDGFYHCDELHEASDTSDSSVMKKPRIASKKYIPDREWEATSSIKLDIS